jgi:hypothetical protein
MTKMIRHVAVFGISVMPLLCSQGYAADKEMSETEKLVVKLATENLSSEKHSIPGYAIERFASWTEDILRDAKRRTWTITTVRKGGQFEFIHAETDGLIIRQLPEVFMLGFTPKTSAWQENLKDTALGLVKATVQGEWEQVQVAAPREIQGVVFLGTGGAFSEDVGTSRNSFVAVVVEKRLWVCLPKRHALGGPWDYGFGVESNKRWFSKLPGGR